MEDLLAPLFRKDDPTGKTDKVNKIFDAANTAAWEAAVTEIGLGGNDKTYIINVTDDFDVPGSTNNTFGSVANITVNIHGGGKTLSLYGNGNMLRIGNLQTVNMQNLELKGHSANNTPLVQVNSGKLVLQGGGKITENIYSTSVVDTGGAGIFMDNGTLEIAGGEINGNTLNGTTSNIGGGAVFAVNNSNILMTGGIIKENNVTVNGSGDTGSRGGGIFLNQNTHFEMTGGIIESNLVTTVATASAHSHGGGVALYETSSFDFKGGTIRNNTCDAVSVNTYGGSFGGGVFLVEGNNNFTMSGGVINGNTVTHSINPNKSYDFGGPYVGQYLDGAYGGGVAVSGDNNTFVKTGGIIYGDDVIGNDADSIPLKNTAQSDSASLGGGHAVYFDNGLGIADKLWRNNTAYAADIMNSSMTGSSGGWE